jgi:hypothetical protein
MLQILLCTVCSLISLLIVYRANPWGFLDIWWCRSGHQGTTRPLIGTLPKVRFHSRFQTHLIPLMVDDNGITVVMLFVSLIRLQSTEINQLSLWFIFLAKLLLTHTTQAIRDVCCVLNYFRLQTRLTNLESRRRVTYIVEMSILNWLKVSLFLQQETYERVEKYALYMPDCKWSKLAQLPKAHLPPLII